MLNSPHNNVFLIGPMGSGKSAVGRHLARKLTLDFLDSDEEIEARTGVDIPYIFEKEGEEGFRRRESALIAELTGLQNIVLATGGGAAQDPQNRQQLAKHGTVIYLYTSVPEQLSRTQNSRHRPLLNNGDPADVLEELMARRDPQYREIADLIVETDGCQVAAVVRQILKKINKE
ncbi:MAG: shikimate kinase AroK [Gammaproteobacteria bacterium]